jgi:hypothetical protein
VRFSLLAWKRHDKQKQLHLPIDLEEVKVAKKKSESSKTNKQGRKLLTVVRYLLCCKVSVIFSISTSFPLFSYPKVRQTQQKLS